MKKRSNSFLKGIRNLNFFVETRFETVPFKGIYITGCRKIKDYGKEKIVLECYGCTATVTGKDLKIENLLNGQMSVVGYITSTEFCK